MADTFVCAHCGGTFGKGWSDEEAVAEAAEMPWAPIDEADQEVICDDCYQAFTAWYERTFT